jgi:hypothetical protein
VLASLVSASIDAVSRYYSIKKSWEARSNASSSWSPVLPTAAVSRLISLAAINWPTRPCTALLSHTCQTNEQACGQVTTPHRANELRTNEAKVARAQTAAAETGRWW